MFRNKYQQGLLSILYSCGASPLEIWDMHVKNGFIRRVTDEEVKSLALEIAGTNVTTTYIFCPKDPKKSLGIKLPFLIMIIKNMKKYFTFEITILDDRNMHRRFRMSNFQSTTRVRPFCTSMPIGLSGSWNQVLFNLSDFTRRAYGSSYMETTRIQIHANCRIRRIYFADRLYSEDELPDDFKLFLPVHRRKCVRESKVEKPKDKDIEKVEVEKPPPFETGEGPEDDIEEGEKEESVESEGVAAEPEPKTDELKEEDEEEDAEALDAGDFEGEDEERADDEIEVHATTGLTSPEYASEEEDEEEYETQQQIM
ncbi:cilia- and flagella-associated protein 20 [Megachile rotundata]|uniref:cilia- and flagella-associated protein 20 n=1 Tax=Megachile rotundata TaxID=143995 RepID=UPI000258EF1E|nr:PREDICTED: cilia- and flagella-associated protein 20-like [Megachile rotundata]